MRQSAETLATQDTNHIAPEEGTLGVPVDDDARAKKSPTELVADWRVRFLTFNDRVPELRVLTEADRAELEAIAEEAAGIVIFSKRYELHSVEREEWGTFHTKVQRYANELRSDSRVELTSGFHAIVPALESDALRNLFHRHGVSIIEKLDENMAMIERSNAKHSVRADEQAALLNRALGDKILRHLLKVWELVDVEVARDALRDRKAREEGGQRINADQHTRIKIEQMIQHRILFTRRDDLNALATQSESLRAAFAKLTSLAEASDRRTK